MQVIYENEVKGVISRRTNPIDIIICPRWISRHLERECYGGIGNKRNRI